jgi:choline dehydrogenase
MSRKKVYDYIIVGAGSSGCVLANRLSSNPSNRVLLIESGKSDNFLPIHVPVGYLACIGNKRTDWCFKTAKLKHLGGRQMAYPRGKVLGGCSSINGMIYMRGQKADYDNWAAFTEDEEWKWDNLMPHFKRGEDYYGGENEFHGTGNEWRVEQARVRWEALDIWMKAAEEIGIPQTKDFNTGSNYGSGYFDVTQRNGWRLNAYQAFVDPVLSRRSNLDVAVATTVSELLFEDDAQIGRSRKEWGRSGSPAKCTGVKYAAGPEGTQEGVIQARREVILASGSIGSVQILERSGIGDGERLSGLGIPVIRTDLPGVGENLQDHLQLRPYYAVHGLPTLNTMQKSLLGKLNIGLEYLLHRSGPMSMAPSQVGCFAYSSDEEERPNLEFHVQPLSLDSWGEPLHTSFDAITASVCNLRPTSRGSVHITSRDSNALPVIDPNYLDTEYDRKVAVEAIRLTRKIMTETRTLAAYNTQEVMPGMEKKTDEEILEGIKGCSSTIFHPVGTARMSRRGDRSADPYGVVDSHCRVHGVSNLRVVDASVMPQITSGNTAAPTMVIAELVASRMNRNSVEETRQS